MTIEDQIKEALASPAIEVPSAGPVLAELRRRGAAQAHAPRRMVRPLLVAAAVTAIAAGGIAVVTTGDGGGGSAPAVRFASAQQVLDTAADRIHVAGDTPVPDGKYRYLDTRQWDTPSCGPSCGLPDGQLISFRREIRTQTWQPSDIDGEWSRKVEVTGQRQWLFGTEEEARSRGFDPTALDKAVTGEWQAAGGRFPKGVYGYDGLLDEWSSPSKERLAQLPRDPEMLYQLLRPEADPKATTAGAEVLQRASRLLSTGAVPADLREALYRALIKTPDLKVTDQVANLDGRKGVALGVPTYKARWEIIVDPDTGEFIGERQVQTESQAGFPAGTVIASSSVRVSVVDERGAVPAGN
ncbi:CU044_5270 family protein [Amycolatopsis sp. cg5]|uniref:CU044_5270 family protein n=1 Tax=Amycolatopsis sp. cg5 TaxID=3238802 RepID=UPI003523FDD0